MHTKNDSTSQSVSEELYGVVRAFVEEWGSHNVLICVPLEWEVIGQDLAECDRMRVAFTTDGSIEVSAFDGGARAAHYRVCSEIVMAEAQGSIGL